MCGATSVPELVFGFIQTECNCHVSMYADAKSTTEGFYTLWIISAETISFEDQKYLNTERVQ